MEKFDGQSIECMENSQKGLIIDKI